MSKMQGTLFEFNQNNELHRKAQHYIETMDRAEFPSLGDLMVTAIVDYFDRYYEQDEGEKTTVDKDLDSRIETAVERALEKKLPEILLPLIEEAFTQVTETPEEEASESEVENSESHDLDSVKKDINWGFLGG